MWYNADGTLWYNNKGICGNEIAKNYRGQVVEEYYFTGENQRGRGTDGYGGVNRKFSKYRQLAMEKYLDENNKQMVVEKLGYARVLNTITDRKLKTREEGYAIVYREYDAHNRVEYEKFYDTDGFAIMLPDGAVSYRYEYNDAGEIIKKTKYDYGDHEVE